MLSAGWEGGWGKGRISGLEFTQLALERVEGGLELGGVYVGRGGGKGREGAEMQWIDFEAELDPHVPNIKCVVSGEGERSL